ncbi:hypothetical protein EH183_40915 [Streptomyces sp. CB01881]|nr:hypothetical protein EH183_40915 [Streptomyces sp. CB01881]
MPSSTACDRFGHAVPTYRIRKPVTGLWACRVPAGWTYSSTAQDIACSGDPFTRVAKYKLRAV